MLWYIRNIVAFLKNAGILKVLPKACECDSAVEGDKCELVHALSQALVLRKHFAKSLSRACSLCCPTVVMVGNSG